MFASYPASTCGSEQFYKRLLQVTAEGNEGLVLHDASGVSANEGSAHEPFCALLSPQTATRVAEVARHGPSSAGEMGSIAAAPYMSVGLGAMSSWQGPKPFKHSF